MRSLFVMDPLDRVHVSGDSTYVSMRECSDRGFPVAMCTPAELYALSGEARGRVTPVRTTAQAPYFHTKAPMEAALGEFDVVWMRKDPPFDMTYILATYMLDMAPPSTLVVNSPAGLKLFNEKLWVAQRWPHLQPDTLLTNDQTRIRDFVRGRAGRTVLKPWDGNGGRGVLITHADDRNLNSAIDLLTAGGADTVIAQAFIEGVERGDKRILLFDGAPVGQMLRVPHSGDYRANMHVGATVEATGLDERDREICAEIGPALREWGMVFVGIDVIAGQLTEINVTSPTGIREINQLDNKTLESDLIDLVVDKVSGQGAR